MAPMAAETATHTLHLPAAHAAAPQAQPRKRSGARALLPQPLAVDEIAGLLRAGFDVEHPGCWGRSAPSAQNWAQVIVYAVVPDAVYRYDAQAQALELLRDRQASAVLPGGAPLTLVYVMDFDPQERRHEEEHGVMTGADAGCIVENVDRRCTASGLAAAVRGRIDRAGVARALRLAPTQRIVVAQAVGHPQPAITH